MSEILEVQDTSQTFDNSFGVARIKVIGIGGGGGNTVSYMVENAEEPRSQNVNFISINTDSQALRANAAETRIQIGCNTTKGLGSGSNPDRGRQAAEESKEDILKNVGNCEIAFITAGMGGGTGTGASPVVANILKKEMDVLTVAVVTRPFSFEGTKQCAKAELGIEKLKNEVDALVVIRNDKLLKGLGGKVTLISAFNECNKVLSSAVKGVYDLITSNGYMNLDFMDVNTVLKNSGSALIGLGTGSGDTAVEDALHQAIHCPLLDDVDGRKASGILVNVTVNPDFPLTELIDLGNKINDTFGTNETTLKYGVTFNDSLSEDQVNVTVLMAGLEECEDAVEQQNPNNQYQDNNGLDGFFKAQPNKFNAAPADNTVKSQKSGFENSDYNLPDFLTHRSK